MLFKKRIMATWLVILLLTRVLLHAGSSSDVWADVFSKIYGIVPMIGLLTFMIISGAYTIEYSSNMNEIINTTKNGKKRIVMAKGIGAGLATAILNLSIVVAVYMDGLLKTSGKGLDLPLKELWYFGNSGSNITVLQMMILLMITVIIGSFFFAQVGLYLSARSRSASIPFIFGGLLMIFPNVLGEFIAQIGYAKYLGITPLWGMMPGELIRYQVPVVLIIIQIVMVIAGFIILPKVTYRAFSTEGER